MKIYAISDLHLSINNPKPMNIFGKVWDNYLDSIASSLAESNQDDLILLAGDLSWAMHLEDAAPDLLYLERFKGEKVIIRGNHDYWWSSISAVRSILPPHVHAVQNDCLRIGNVLVSGSRGWSLDDSSEKGKKLIDRELIRLRLSLDDMQKQRLASDYVVAMIHYPPFAARPAPSPFTTLFSEYKVDAVIYGHLHGKSSRAIEYVKIDNVDYYLTSCDLINNKAVIIKEL